MHAYIDGDHWRLRFHHTRAPIGTKQHNVKGKTTCFVELWQDTGGEPGILGYTIWTQGSTICGRTERGFNKEQGRQFSLVRALRYQTATWKDKRIAAALIEAYVRSGKRDLCLDLQQRGYKSLYQAVFGPKVV